MILILISVILFNIPTESKLFKHSLDFQGSLLNKVSNFSSKFFDSLNFFINRWQTFSHIKYESQSFELNLARLNQLLLTIDKLKLENQELKKLITVIDANKNFHYQAAKLLGVAISPHSKVALINGGTNQKINIDQIVVNYQGLVGRIIETSNNFSKVLLIDDYSMKIPVTTLTSNEKAIAQGSSNNLLKLKYLQEGHKAIRGEMVVTSGDGIIYPYGILVGVITEVNNSEVLVTPSSNLYLTDMVAIVDITN